MPESLKARVIAALSRIQNPRLEADLLSAGMVRDLTVTPEGAVSFTFLLSREDPATLVREARSAVSGVDGVRKDEVKIAVADPSGPARATHPPPGAVPASVAPPPAPEQPNLGKIIAISSGKGGVGKSTVAANLAVALTEAGHAVAIMDADIYGPNIPRMFGVFDKPPVLGGRIQPLAAYGVKLMSLGLLVERDAPAIWRGPIIMKVIQQFLRDVDWGRLDYFLVDLPPGTGDAQLSLVQSTHVSGALIVTTPQEVAVGDALRGARMFERVGVPVLGVVENMSGYTDPETGRRVEFFASGGGARLAAEIGAPLLGEVPLQPRLAAYADEGRPVVVAEPDSPAAATLRAIATALVKEAGGRTVELPILRG
ncbi:MAG TPA: Mrp/NBP35 family ATP-binding protein [Gemmatimonadales bacterium]|jgi:ATP-binding protein involved in chromosome partitioning|nr:Mrp/NBP35 family ATP-binding protein [Gemmatimonadales bacterium]